MAKVEITREGTRLVDVRELMKAERVKETLRFAVQEFRDLPGPKARRRRDRSQASAPTGNHADER